MMGSEENYGILNINSTLYKTRVSKKFAGRKPYKPPNPKAVLSFIPGTVLDILVKEGQPVLAGDDLMILDAMKMQNKLKAASDGKIKRICVAKGEKVSKGSILIELE